jgi:hypothetical protein
MLHSGCRKSQINTTFAVQNRKDLPWIIQIKCRCLQGNAKIPVRGI